MEELKLLSYSMGVLAVVVMGLMVSDNGSPPLLKACRDTCPTPTNACSTDIPSQKPYIPAYRCISVANYSNPTSLRQGDCPFSYWMGDCPGATAKQGLCHRLSVGRRTCYSLAPQQDTPDDAHIPTSRLSNLALFIPAIMALIAASHLAKLTEDGNGGDEVDGEEEETDEDGEETDEDEENSDDEEGEEDDERWNS